MRCLELLKRLVPLVVPAALTTLGIWRLLQSYAGTSAHVALFAPILAASAAGLLRYRSNIARLARRARIAAALRESDLLKILGVASVRLVDDGTVCVETGGATRFFGLIRLTGRPYVPSSEVGARGRADLHEYRDLFRRVRDFISGLQKCGLPIAYSVILHPTSRPAEAKGMGSPSVDRLSEGERLRMGERFGFFRADVLISTWVDGGEPPLDELDANVRSILASILTAFPEMEARRLGGPDLVETLGSVLSGGGQGGVLVVPEVVPVLPSIVPSPSSMRRPEPRFNLPNPAEVAREGPFLGWVSAYRRSLYKVNLSLEEFPAHIAIFGITGSGKSTTASAIVARALEFGIKTLVFDWHNEYRGLILSKRGLVFTPGRDISPLTINPFDRSLSADLNEHIGLVTDVFADVFSFTEPQSFMFMEATRLAYEHSPDLVTLSTVLSEIERMPVRSRYDVETKLALFRRLKPLTGGQAGKALNGPSTIDLETLLGNLVSIELGHFKEQRVRKTFVSILLKLIYDYRTRGPSRGLRHITLLEEARNIIPPRSSDEEPSIGERIIGELRKFGECIVIVTQFPTQISSEILKNAAIRICHQVKTLEDQRILRGAMKLTEEQATFLHDLGPGYAVIDLPSADDPFLIYIEPTCDLQTAHIDDDHVAQSMMGRVTVSK